MPNISVTGQSGLITFSNSLKGVPFELTEFSDDTGAITVNGVQIGDGAMGINGHFVTWATANSLDVEISVIPGGNDDKNLSAAFNMNRVQAGKSVANDTVTLAWTYPDGQKALFTTGICAEYAPLPSADASGRKTTKTYSFKFGGFTG